MMYRGVSESLNSENDTVNHQNYSKDSEIVSVNPKYLLIQDDDLDNRSNGSKFDECEKDMDMECDSLECDGNNGRGETPYTCKKCSNTFDDIKEYEEHKKKHRVYKPPKKTKQCTVCNKWFISNYRLQRHLVSHTDEKPYSCTVCAKKFKEPRAVRLHMNVHREDKPYKCSICERGFLYECQVRVHMNCHSTEAKYQCKECGKFLKCEKNLRTHQKLHTREYCYKCSICGREFIQASDLKRHELTHTPDKLTPDSGESAKHKCNVCNRSFVFACDLTRHSKIHLEEKPFLCSICSKRFKQLGGLRSHMLSHSEEKPKVCKICGKGFKSVGGLRQHVATHTGERPHKCSICNMGFTTAGHMRRHMGTVHKSTVKVENSDTQETTIDSKYTDLNSENSFVVNDVRSVDGCTDFDDDVKDVKLKVEPVCDIGSIGEPIEDESKNWVFHVINVKTEKEEVNDDCS